MWEACRVARLTGILCAAIESVSNYLAERPKQLCKSRGGGVIYSQKHRDADVK